MTGNRVKINLLAVMSVCLLWGCTAEPVIDVGPTDARPVTLVFARPDLGASAPGTRAGETTLPEQLPTGATVRIAAYYLRKGADGAIQPAAFETSPPTYEATYEVQGDGSLSPCKVDADGKKIAGTATGLSVRGGTYDFYAVSPARPLQQGSDSKYQITNIPHKEDIMTSFARSVAVSATSNVVALNTFTRQCALVVFNVAPSPDNVLPFDQLYGTSLILQKVSTSGASLIAGESTGIPPTGGSGGATAEVTFSGDDFELVEGSNPAGLNKAKGVVLPKNNMAFDVSLTVFRDDESATLSATIDKNIAFDRGKKYIFTLEVKNNESRLLLTVLNWTSISFTDAGVGGPDPDRPTNPDIDTGTGTTIEVARWDNMPWTGNGLVGNSPTVRIDDSVLKGYYARVRALHSSYSWKTHPPFDADGVNTAASHGLTNVVLSDNPSMTGYYQIQVQSTDPGAYPYQSGSSYPARDYCKTVREGDFTDWRLPTMIELYAMWDKARGGNNNATDSDPDSSVFGAPFNAGYNWSSSVYSGDSDRRCLLHFESGTFYANPTTVNLYVRCVRDKT